MLWSGTLMFFVFFFSTHATQHEKHTHAEGRSLNRVNDFVYFYFYFLCLTDRGNSSYDLCMLLFLFFFCSPTVSVGRRSCL